MILILKKPEGDQMLVVGRGDPPAGHVQRRTGQDRTGPDRTGEKETVLTACPLPVARYLLVTGGSTGGPLMVR